MGGARRRAEGGKEGRGSRHRIDADSDVSDADILEEDVESDNSRTNIVHKLYSLKVQVKEVKKEIKEVYTRVQNVVETALQRMKFDNHLESCTFIKSSAKEVCEDERLMLGEFPMLPKHIIKQSIRRIRKVMKMHELELYVQLLYYLVHHMNYQHNYDTDKFYRHVKCVKMFSGLPDHYVIHGILSYKSYKSMLQHKKHHWKAHEEHEEFINAFIFRDLCLIIENCIITNYEGSIYEEARVEMSETGEIFWPPTAADVARKIGDRAKSQFFRKTSNQKVA